MSASSINTATNNNDFNYVNVDPMDTIFTNSNSGTDSSSDTENNSGVNSSSNMGANGPSLREKLKNIPGKISKGLEPENQMETFKSVGKRIVSFYTTVYAKFAPVRNAVASPFSKIEKVAKILTPVKAEEGEKLTFVQKALNTIKKVISVQDEIAAGVGKTVQKVCYILNAIPVVGNILQVTFGFTARAVTTVAFVAFDLAVASVPTAIALAGGAVAVAGVAGTAGVLIGTSPLWAGPVVLYLGYKMHQMDKKIEKLQQKNPEPKQEVVDESDQKFVINTSSSESEAPLDDKRDGDSE